MEQRARLTKLDAARGGRRRYAGSAGAAACLLVLWLCGCALLPPNSFLDQTKVGRFPGEMQETGIRRILTPRELPESYASATEPTPEDLIPYSTEYRIGPGDTLGISIDDLLEQGRPFQIQQEVNENGYVRISRLGQVYVAGMSEAELEQELAARVREAGLVPDPVVIIIAQVKRNRYFSILGDVLGPGSYGIPQHDFRILDALGIARGLGANSKKLLVIRRLDTAGAGRGGAAPGTPPQPRPDDTDRGATPPTRPGDYVIPPPEEPNGTYGQVSFVQIGGPSGRDGRSAYGREDDGAAQETSSAPVPPQPADVPPLPEAPGAAPRLIMDPATGEMIEVRPAQEPSASRPGESQGLAARPNGVPPDVDLPFDWDALPDYELTQRVIEIDAEALQAGDPRMNIVIRDRDMIRAPFDTGLFYLMGEVNRPGVYGFGGRSITMKQAIGAIGGGFSPLAWPERVEIIRREKGTDKQITIPVNMDKIFAGLAEDVELQDDDLVNVGTHFFAPFLFVIRNSFRFTYGFGFVYDRNFADKDSYSQRINPEIINQQRRANRGLPF